jgi:hypothetical protein
MWDDKGISGTIKESVAEGVMQVTNPLLICLHVDSSPGSGQLCHIVLLPCDVNPNTGISFTSRVETNLDRAVVHSSECRVN